MTKPEGAALIARLEAVEAEALRQLKASDDELVAQGGWDAASWAARRRHAALSTEFVRCREDLVQARQEAGR